MPSLNRATLIGHLGRDPEIRSLQNGNRVCHLSVATSEKWKDRATGERKEHTEWHRIVIFNDHLVDIAERYAGKGDKVFIEGPLKTRKWTDNSGQEKYTTEIVLNQYGGKLLLLGGGGGERPARNEKAPQQSRQPALSGLDDEIPF